MIKKIYTAAIIVGLLGICFVPEVYSAEKLTGKQKKEISLLDKAKESFENQLLEYPQYTRPVDFEGRKVPDVLMSGHHENIRKWRLKESLKRTYLLRPDLLDGKELTKEETKMLEEIKSGN